MNNIVVVDTSIIRNSTLSASAKILLILLLSYSAEERQELSIRTIKRDLNASQTLVTRAKNELVRGGWIQVTSQFDEWGGQVADQYTICEPSPVMQGND